MGAEETGRSALVFDPDLSVKARRRLVFKLWFEIGESESVIDLADLDEPFRMLLFRAQRAISNALNSGVYVADMQSRNVGETVLRRHEWEIATALRDLTKLNRDHKRSNVSTSGPMTAAVLKSQERALTLAQSGTTSRIDALERYATQLQAADAAKSDWLDALKVSRANDRYLDLVARTAADEHAIAEINDLTEQSSIAQQVFQDCLYEVTLAAAALTLPGPQN